MHGLDPGIVEAQHILQQPALAIPAIAAQEGVDRMRHGNGLHPPSKGRFQWH